MMKFLFILAWLNAGNVSLFVQPVATLDECGELMMSFYVGHEDADFEASCVDIIKSLGDKDSRKADFNG